MAAPHAWQSVGSLAWQLLAPNPGPMTLEGTNTYLLRAPGTARCIIVDPGPLLPDHLAALAAAGDVALILLTHHHGDHADGAARLHELTGAPVRAAAAGLCLGAPALRDGELLEQAGVRVRVLATPGHTSDSLCFLLDAAQPAGERVLLSGDTILGRGSTVLCYPDGRLGDYLASLDRLNRLGSEAGPVPVLPGHGPVLPDLAAVTRAYATHRRERLREVAAAVARLRRTGSEPTAERVTELVYAAVPASLRAAALLSVQAQLQYLATAPGTP